MPIPQEVIAFPTKSEVHIKTSPPTPLVNPLSLIRRGDIKHSFIGVRLIRTSLGQETLYLSS